MTTPNQSIPTTVIRHSREKISKCSLRFIHDRPEMTFMTAIANFKFNADGFILLAVDAPPLTEADAGSPLLLLDATWRLLPKLQGTLQGNPIPRSIPGGIPTAYPRVSKNFEDPTGGLASIEALYVARYLLGDRDETLLDGYEWKAEFLEMIKGKL